MARMNWDKVRKENLVRSQGSLRVPPEQAWAEPARKKRKKKTRNARPATVQRPLKECPNCHAMVRETRLERHVSEACPHRRGPRRRGEVKRTPAAVRPKQAAPIRARIVGPAEKFETCRDCAVEVPASRLSRHQAGHKVLRPTVSERQASRRGVRTVRCSHCGELVRVDLLKQHVTWHVPASSRVVRDRTTSRGLPSFGEAMASRGGMPRAVPGGLPS